MLNPYISREYSRERRQDMLAPGRGSMLGRSPAGRGSQGGRRAGRGSQGRPKTIRSATGAAGILARWTD